MPDRRQRNPNSRAFSSEVDTGSREENASKQKSRAPFRFYRNGKGSRAGWILIESVRPAAHFTSPIGRARTTAGLYRAESPAPECRRRLEPPPSFAKRFFDRDPIAGVP